MTIVAQVRKTYKYRLYASKRDDRLHDQINIAGIIWNHITALQKRYYSLFGKHITEGRMKKHIAKLRMKTARFAYWQKLGSQAVQEICERHEETYQRFFKKQGGLPRFRKVKKFKSFVLKQAGWKLHEEMPDRKYRKITIGKTEYKMVYHRPLKGTVKTISVKRDALGRLWICFSVVEEIAINNKVSTGKIGGFDFGLKTFLVNDEGQSIESPQFYAQGLPKLRRIQSHVSKKVKSSANHRRGSNHIARRQIRISDKRRDFHYNLAHALCDHYDVMVFEDLNIQAMKKLWGRKISDLGFARFIDILKWVAFKCGKRVILIDRFERTTGKCSSCGHQQKLELKDRVFECGDCGFTLDRDHNAAINILEAGHRLILSQSESDLA